MSSLNLSRIVLRLAQNSRGWRVSDLCAELGIAPRTYRKYRRQLQEEFQPFFQGGVSRVREVKEAGERYLRLVDPHHVRGPECQVDLVFAADRWLQRYVRECVPFFAPEFEDVTGGRLRLRARVGDLEEAKAWTRQFGSDVEVLRPSSLRIWLARELPQG